MDIKKAHSMLVNIKANLEVMKNSYEAASKVVAELGLALAIESAKAKMADSPHATKSIDLSKNLMPYNELETDLYKPSKPFNIVMSGLWGNEVTEWEKSKNKIIIIKMIRTRIPDICLITAKYMADMHAGSPTYSNRCSKPYCMYCDMRSNQGTPVFPNCVHGVSSGTSCKLCLEEELGHTCTGHKNSKNCKACNESFAKQFEELKKPIPDSVLSRSLDFLDDLE